MSIRFIKSTSILFLVCSLSACSLAKKPKEWFEKEEDPREPTKLTKLETEEIRVQSVWRNSIGSLEESFNKIHPFITDTHVYLTDAEGRVESWQRADGKNVWSVNLKQEISGGVNGGDGILALGTEEGVVIAINLTDGVEKWRTTLTSEIMSISETGFGVILVRTNDSKVHALDIGNGNIAWAEDRNPPALTLRGASVPVIVGDAALVAFDDGKMMALSLRDGSQLWETAVSIPRGRSELERMSDIDGEIVYLDGVVYAVSLNGRVIAIDMDTGRSIWTKDLSSHAGLSVDERRIYVTDTDDSIYALDKTNGATIWRQDKLLYREVTAPGVMGNYIVVGDFKGYLHWLSKEDGKLVGRENLTGDAILIPPIVINQRAYVLAINGSFSVLEYRQ